MVYVLLDGVGDLPHPNLVGKTPLGAASTPNLDRLAKNGTMGQVITVGKGIAPESDIAVSSGVFPPKSGCGRSPTPSNSTKTILISELSVIFFHLLCMWI